MSDIPNLPRFVSDHDFITWGPGRCGYCGVQYKSDNDPRYIHHVKDCKAKYDAEMVAFRAARERLKTSVARVEPKRLTLKEMRALVKKIRKR